MRLLKDLGVPSLLSEYFKNLKSTKMAAQSEENIMNFLLMISDEKKYRPFIVNKGIIDYLKNLFDNHGGTKVKKSKLGDDPKKRGFFGGIDKDAKRMKEKIDKLVSRIGCHVNPQVLSYNLQHFIFDILCHAVENSAHELTIFESLMGLTNFTANNTTFAERLFFTNKTWTSIYSHIFDANLFVSTSSLELLNNLLLSEKIW